MAALLPIDRQGACPFFQLDVTKAQARDLAYGQSGAIADEPMYNSATGKATKSSCRNGDSCQSDLRDETGQPDFDEDLVAHLRIFRNLTEVKNKTGGWDAFGKSMLKPCGLSILDSLMAEGHPEFAVEPEHSAADHHEPSRSQQLFLIKRHFFHQFNIGSAA